MPQNQSDTENRVIIGNNNSDIRVYILLYEELKNLSELEKYKFDNMKKFIKNISNFIEKCLKKINVYSDRIDQFIVESQIKEQVTKGLFKKQLSDNEILLNFLKSVKGVFQVFNTRMEQIRLNLKYLTVTKKELEGIYIKYSIGDNKKTPITIISDFEAKKFFVNLAVQKVCQNNLKQYKEEIQQFLESFNQSDNYKSSENDFSFNDTLCFQDSKIFEINYLFEKYKPYENFIKQYLENFHSINTIVKDTDKLFSSFKDYEKILKNDVEYLKESFFYLRENELNFFIENFYKNFELEDFWLINKYFLDNSLELEIKNIDDDFRVQAKYYKSFFEQKKVQKENNGVLVNAQELSYCYQRIRTIVSQLCSILKNQSPENLLIFYRLRFDNLEYLCFTTGHEDEYAQIEKSWKKDNQLLKSLSNTVVELGRIKISKSQHITNTIQDCLTYALEISDYVLHSLVQLKKNWGVIKHRFLSIGTSSGQGIWKSHKETFLNSANIKTIQCRNLIQEKTYFHQLNMFFMNIIENNIQIMTSGIRFVDYEEVSITICQSLKRVNNEMSQIFIDTNFSEFTENSYVTERAVDNVKLEKDPESLGGLSKQDICLKKCCILLQIFDVLREKMKSTAIYVEELVSFIEDYTQDIGYVFEVGQKTIKKKFSKTDKNCVNSILQMKSEFYILVEKLQLIFTKLNKNLENLSLSENKHDKTLISKLKSVVDQSNFEIKTFYSFENAAKIIFLNKIISDSENFFKYCKQSVN